MTIVVVFTIILILRLADAVSHVSAVAFGKFLKRSWIFSGSRFQKRLIRAYRVLCLLQKRRVDRIESAKATALRGHPFLLAQTVSLVGGALLVCVDVLSIGTVAIRRRKSNSAHLRECDRRLRCRIDRSRQRHVGFGVRLVNGDLDADGV